MARERLEVNITSGRSRGGGGAQQARTPPKKKKKQQQQKNKLDQLCFFLPNIFIRMFKAQIARESIKTTLELPGPLSGPWTPAKSEFGFALVMCVRAHKLLHPPPPPENPGSAAASLQMGKG